MRQDERKVMSVECKVKYVESQVLKFRIPYLDCLLLLSF